MLCYISPASASPISHHYITLAGALGVVTGIVKGLPFDGLAMGFQGRPIGGHQDNNTTEIHGNNYFICASDNDG